MSDTKILITDAGLAEIRNAEASGTDPVVLSHIAFGTGQYTPTANLTALKAEFKRFDTIKGGAIGDNIIHLTLHDNSTDTYTVNEVGVFTDKGTLFGVYSQNTPILQKAANAETMLAIDIALEDIDAASITVGDTTFVLNPATTTKQGVIELATEAEAKAGTDTSRAITPKTLDATIEAHDNVVHRSGAEAISGYKCFTGDVGKRNNNADISTVPENNTYSSFDFSDKNNKKYASVVGATYNDGDVGAILAANRTINGVEYHSQIHARLDDKGTPYATAPTPAAGDNSTKIATTAFVNTKASNYLPLAGGTMQGIINCNGKPFTNPSYIEFKPNSTNNGGYLDFHFAGSTEDYTSRIIEDGEGRLTMVAPSGVRINNKNLVQSVNNTNADANGNVSITSVASATSATKATQDGNGNVIADTYATKNYVDTEKAKYLPRAGGSMTTTKAMTRDVADSFLGLHGGTGENNDGAQLYLCGANHPSMPSMFQLHARNADTDVILQGGTDGVLEWDGKYVLNNSYQMPTDGGAINLTAGTSSAGGAYFRLYGKEHESGAGQFVLATTDGESTNALVGKPDGTLTWMGKPVATGATSTITYWE